MFNGLIQNDAHNTQLLILFFFTSFPFHSISISLSLYLSTKLLSAPLKFNYILDVKSIEREIKWYKLIYGATITTFEAILISPTTNSNQTV